MEPEGKPAKETVPPGMDGCTPAVAGEPVLDGESVHLKNMQKSSCVANILSSDAGPTLASNEQIIDSALDERPAIMDCCTKRSTLLAVSVSAVACCLIFIVTGFSVWMSMRGQAIPPSQQQDVEPIRLGNVHWLPAGGNSSQFNITTFRPGKGNSKPLVHKLLVDSLLPPPITQNDTTPTLDAVASIQSSKTSEGPATPRHANIAIVAHGNGQATIFARAPSTESALYVSDATLASTEHYDSAASNPDRLGQVTLAHCRRDCVSECERACSDHPSGRCTAWTLFNDGNPRCELFSACELRSGASPAVVTGTCRANCPSQAYATGDGVYLGRRRMLQGQYAQYEVYPRNTCAPFHSNPDSGGGKKVGMTKWKSLGGVVKDGPSAFSPDRSSTAAFVRGSDDQIWYIQRRGQWWGSWQAISGSATSSPAATGKGLEMLVFVRGSDSQLWMASTDDAGSSWRWTALGGALLAGTSPSAARSPTGDGFEQIAVTNVVVVGTDQRLWQLQLRGTTVDRDWRELPGTSGLQITSSPSVFAYDAARRQTTVEVLVRGPDGVTVYQTRSIDNGITFSGGWEALPDGFRVDSSPASSSWESQEAIVGAVARNTRVHLQLRRLPNYGGPRGQEWTRLRKLPEGEQPAISPPVVPANPSPSPPPYQSPDIVDCGATPIRPSPEAAPSLGVGCIPCGSCSFWDRQCWAVCEINCYRVGDCIQAGAGLETMAAKRSCAFVWEACGVSTSRGRFQTSSATFDNLLSVGKENCAAIVEDYCRDSLWTVDLFAIIDASYEQSCGEIVYGGSPRCTEEFAFSLFAEMVDSSCRLAVAEFYSPGAE